MPIVKITNQYLDVDESAEEHGRIDSEATDLYFWLRTEVERFFHAQDLKEEVKRTIFKASRRISDMMREEEKEEEES